MDDGEIQREDAAVLPQPHANPALESGPGGTESVFFGAGDPQHHRSIGLLAQQRRHGHDRVRSALGAESSAAGFGDVHQVFLIHAQQPAEPGDQGRLALGGAVQDAFAVFPVGHATARFHAVMGEAGGDEAFVDHHGGFLEAGVHVAIGPFGNRRAHGKLALPDGGKIRCAPLDRLGLDTPARHVTVAAGVGSAGVEALERVEGKGKRFEVQLDQVDRVLGGGLVHRGHCENGFTDVTGFVGEDRRGRGAGRLRRRDVVGGQYRVDAFQGQGGGGIDIAHAGVRHRACEELAEEHALGTEILRVLGLSGDFAAYIRRHEIPANQRISHVVLPFLSDTCARNHVRPPRPSEINTKTGTRSCRPGRRGGRLRFAYMLRIQSTLAGNRIHVDQQPGSNHVTDISSARSRR